MLGVTFSSWIHFELIFLYGGVGAQLYSFACGSPVVPVPFLEVTISPLNCVGIIVKKSVDYKREGLFLDSLSIPLIQTSVLMPAPWVFISFAGLKSTNVGTYLVIQWLRLHASTAVGAGSIPGQGTKIRFLHAVWHSQKKGNQEM